MLNQLTSRVKVTEQRKYNFDLPSGRELTVNANSMYQAMLNAVVLELPTDMAHVLTELLEATYKAGMADVAKEVRDIVVKGISKEKERIGHSR